MLPCALCAEPCLYGSGLAALVAEGNASAALGRLTVVVYRDAATRGAALGVRFQLGGGWALAEAHVWVNRSGAGRLPPDAVAQYPLAYYAPYNTSLPDYTLRLVPVCLCLPECCGCPGFTLPLTSGFLQRMLLEFGFYVFFVHLQFPRRSSQIGLGHIVSSGNKRQQTATKLRLPPAGLRGNPSPMVSVFRCRT